MASTFTPNIQLEEPARGDDVGVWDTPVNNNMTLIDKVVGGSVAIPLNNSPVVLSAAQFQSRQLVFQSTLTGNVAITFPASFSKDYVVFNTCTGSSAFVVTLQTTVAGAPVLGCPPGDGVTVYNFGAGGGLFFVNLGRIGSYMDFGGSSVPAWITACTVPPYLNCDGSVFSAVTYPALAAILGGTTLPDSKGRFRATLNQGSGRLTSSQGGVDGNTKLAGGGNNGVLLSTSQVPTITSSGTITLTPNNGAGILAGSGGVLGSATVNNGSALLTFAVPSGVINVSAVTGGGTVNFLNPGQSVIQNAPSAYVGGITMIRSA